MNRLSKIKKLLEENVESYYWIGFILADGHISNKNRLAIGLSIKDYNHLIKFVVNYLNLNKNTIKISNRLLPITNKKYKKCQFQIMDVETLSKISKKFDINSNKTYYPPKNLNFYYNMDKILFFSLLIGIIDGDGCIKHPSGGRKDYNIILKLHSNWLEFLNLIKSRLEKELNIIIPPARINNSGYAFIVFSSLMVCRFLKQFVIENKLPILNRKWDIIDQNRKSKYEITYENTLKINEFLKKGFKQSEISKLLNISNATVSNAKNRKSSYLCKNYS